MYISVNQLTAPKQQFSRALDGLAFLIPVLMAWDMQIVGRLMLGEIIALAALPILLVNKPPSFYAGNNDNKKYFIVLLMAYFFAQVLSDLVNQTPMQDLLRGWANILFLASNALFFYLLIQAKPKRIIWALYGLGVFNIISGYQSFSDVSHIWKFGGGLGITIILLLWFRPAKRKNRRKQVVAYRNIVILLTLSIFSFMLNARSLGGILLATGFVYGFLSRVQYSNRLNIKRKNILKIAGIGSIAFLVGLFVYDAGAPAGWFGEKAQQKYQSQYIEGYGIFGIIFGGRSEFMVASQAVADAPLLGHGSWAKDVRYRIMLAGILQDLRDEAYNRDWGYYAQSTLIPAHSHIFQSWINAGVVGGIFWFGIMLLFYRLLKNWGWVPVALRPMLMLITIISLWDILFSPFGGEKRLYWALVLAILIVVIDKVAFAQRDNRQQIEAIPS